MKKFAAFLILALVLCSSAVWPMNNPGPITLGDFQVGAAATQNGTPVQLLAGMNAVSVQARFAYGSGGTTANVYIQTTLDQGQSWIDIAAICFTTSGSTQIANLSALDKLATPQAPTSLSLTCNTTVDGILGDQLRAVVVSTGTYAGGTLASIRAVVR